MKTVETVRGPVSVDALGSVLMHEHLCTSSMGIATHYPQMYREHCVETIAGDMKEIKEEGILTVIDAAPVCLGRDVRTLKKASEMADSNIIATTGWFGVEPPYVGPTTVDMWARCFIDDLTVGCDGSDIKAGILKAAMDMDGPTEWRKKTHYAVGLASVETGTNIMLHTYCPMETPRHQLQFLKDVGVDMNKVSVGHIPETTDMDFVKWIYDQGVWMGMDRIPCLLMPGAHSVGINARIKLIKEMLDAGMGDRMLFSHDIGSTSTLYDNQPPEIVKFVNDQCPDHFLFIKKHVFPALAEMGVDPDYLWNLTIDNPRRFFAGE